jgi:oxepin-CoA hydrolase/3-oxo-5,6-dehydrosuberyl-CoA semialdehyde dehydrogenase
MSGKVSLDVGRTLRGASRTVTDVEIALLPAIMGAISPLFHDEPTARAGRMGGRILYGPALLGISVALTEPFLHDQVVGLVEITDVRFRRPVKVGDTVTATMSIRARCPRDGKPGVLLTIDDEIRNQDGEVVLTFERLILIKGD